MNNSLTRAKSGRRVSLEKRDAILDAAYRSFSLFGLGISVEKIAKEAGVAKQTIYNSYSNKEQLFSAGIMHASQKVIKILHDCPLDTPRKTLSLVAEEYCRLTLSRAGMEMITHLMMRRNDSRALVENIFNVGPGEIISQLAHYLERATLEKKLNVKNPFLAADLFMGSLKGYIRERYWLKLTPPPTGRELQSRIDYAVDLFLLAHKV